MSLIISLLLSFLIGSIPTGYLIARLHGVDLREVGSGNTGATNAGRILGKKAGIITLIIDFLKGIIGIEAGLFILQNIGATPSFDPSAPLAFAAVCGHCFSPWLSFKGGKGVATGGGVLFYLAPIQSAVGLISFALCFRVTKIVSLSSCIAAAVIPCLLYFTGVPAEIKFAATAISILVIYRHKENISRLMAGTEKQFSLKKSDSECGKP